MNVTNCDVDTEALIVELFVCPFCRMPLLRENVPSTHGSRTSFIVRCNDCSRSFPGIDDSIDFVDPKDQKADERGHYDRKYHVRTEKSERKAIHEAEWFPRWRDTHFVEFTTILRHLGDVSDRLLLCLGNGSSVKESYFLHLGARVIFSDLSFSGVLIAKAKLDLDDYAERVWFHAVSAYAIPLPDCSVDLVYGYEFVHHLPELTPFLDEVRRVLRPGGLCVFFDPAYSRIWQSAKMTVLWPLMKLRHLVQGISPEDLRVTYTGGFREEKLSDLVREHGFVRPFFERTRLFGYLAMRGSTTFIGWGRPQWCYWIQRRLGYWMDALLTNKIGFLAHNRLEMVWGFEKPRSADIEGGGSA